MPKIVVVTGTSTGLGTSIAIQSAQAGHRVYATMRDLSKGSALAAAAAGAGVALEVLQLDVQDDASVAAAVAAVIQREGRIDVLVNNAGVGFARSTEQARLEDIARVIDINFTGVVRCTRAVMPHMRQARSGHVINISSVGGLVGQPFNEIYCAAKFAVEGYTESLASYVQPSFGIKFTAIEPGGIQSEFGNTAMQQLAQTGGMLDDEYLPIIQKYLAGARQRSTAAFQSSDAVAEVVLHCMAMAEPPVRMRTSAWGEALCAIKTGADPDGKKLQQQVIDTFLGG